ncbi:GNAT family N-acetyltransferase [Streptococcus didelphis]|uniref:GNAT family N-acetyltransferase n=1 Tax=Streptococcus didelphis TaxID=102886 RepID=A0ABY9LIS6_9STRE|nr:GNAT family N-acetyltransferase [Streptococcus didelphis]WMB28734.1 GNAT family N-acetyltransferase [Streptococcus didelphis]WMB30200.1 GNAT family N-acetyltransferase [Streptococcus didelphis]
MWHIKGYKELSRDDLFAIYKLRVSVFVVEQNCPYQEVDEDDLNCLHAMNWENQRLVAYYRLIPEQEKNLVHLGRVIVAKDFRGTGMGRDLLSHAITSSKKRYPQAKLHAQAQAYLQEFYETFGFKAVSDIYLEDDIAHLDMILQD